MTRSTDDGTHAAPAAQQSLVCAWRPGDGSELVAGWWLAISQLTSALACFVTLVGIPFGIQRIKLALIAPAPIGSVLMHV